MKSPFRADRRNQMNKKGIGKYLLNALGEIVLIIIRILIAVKISDKVKENQDSKIKCEYLNLLYRFEHALKR